MSRSITSIASQAPVAPGTAVVIPVYTDTGFSAGDYVYTSTNNSVGFPRSASVNLPTTGYIIASTLTQSTQASTGQQACYGPLGPPQAVYTGTSTTAGTVLSTTVVEAVATGSNCCAVGLTGGNIAVAWQSGASGGSNNVKYAVYGPDGVTVIQPATVVATNLYTSNPALVAIAATSNDRFFVFYVNNSGQQIFYRYLSTGVNIDGPISWGAGIYSSGYVLGASFVGHVGYSNYTGSGYYGILNNGGGSTFFATGPNGNSAKSVLMGLVGANSNTMYAYTVSGSGTVGWESRLINTGTAITSGTFSPSSSSVASFTGCALSNGNFMIAYWVAPFLRIQIYTPGGTNAGTPTLTLSYTEIPQASNFNPSSEMFAVATPNGGFMIVQPMAGSNFYNLYGTLSSGTYTFTGGNFGLANVNAGQFGITAGAMTNGNAVLGYRNGSQYPTISTVTTQTFVNGVTQLTGSGSFAAPSYVLLGVAANTAAAGSTGSVIINGPATLNSNYPNVTSPIVFDYTGQGVFGNKGTVAGRVANLRGLE
jgi:hypothetical protein